MKIQQSNKNLIFEIWILTNLRIWTLSTLNLQNLKASWKVNFFNSSHLQFIESMNFWFSVRNVGTYNMSKRQSPISTKIQHKYSFWTKYLTRVIFVRVPEKFVTLKRNGRTQFFSTTHHCHSVISEYNNLLTKLPKFVHCFLKIQFLSLVVSELVGHASLALRSAYLFAKGRDHRTRRWTRG